MEIPLLIRGLTVTDAFAFREIRLEGLQQHPDAFGSSHEEEVEKPNAWFQDTLATGLVVGCDIGNRLAGIAGLFIPSAIKMRHRGTLWGMYVIADERRHGVGLELVRAIIALAKGKVEELTLSVAVHNEPAIGLYYRVGFVDYGLDRRALRVDNEYVDEILMKLPLKADVPSRPSLMV